METLALAAEPPPPLPLLSSPTTPPDLVWRLKIKTPTVSGAMVTLYFKGRASRWEDVKLWIEQQIGVPTCLFHLILAISGYKLNNTNFIDGTWINPWQTIAVVLKEL